MDFSMPECNGPKATKIIRKIIKKAGLEKNQPLICCLTAYTEDQYKIAAKEAGMDLVLIKPIFKTSAQMILSKCGLL